MPRYFEPELISRPIAGRLQAWREAGAGDRLPLVLLHGIGSNSRAWAGQFAGFAAERRVVAWNAPGYAGSAPLASEWPIPGDYAQALGVLLDHVSIARCVLVGQSLGAVMATAFALGRPDRVAALVLASPASGYGVPAGKPLPDGIAQRIADVETLGPEGLAAARYGRLLSHGACEQAHAIVRQAMAEVVPRGYVQASRLLASADLTTAVAGLSVPVTTLWGGADVITPPARCATVAAAAPGGVGIEIPGGGHAMATQRPEQFNQALRTVLADADAREGVMA
ncbi:alpha/beta fold hydrolase [Sphingomonas sp.]|uniref:alpha/beta fold hydrolase n=1 Tax=Sphingomonas sp. TaxID=28214 RepID=UPI003BAC0C0F